MKTKLEILLETKDGNLEITYSKNNLEEPKDDNERALIKYVENVVRAIIDNGFLPVGDKNGDSVQKQ